MSKRRGYFVSLVNSDSGDIQPDGIYGTNRERCVEAMFNMFGYYVQVKDEPEDGVEYFVHKTDAK